MESLSDLTISLLGIQPKEILKQVWYLYTNVHTSAICNSQKVKTTQIFMWIDKTWSNHVLEWHQTINKQGRTDHSTTWVSLQNITLREKATHKRSHSV